MNLKLAEFLESVPSEFTVTSRDSDSIRYKHENKEIYIGWFSSGQPLKVSYYENDQPHRPFTEGPAHQSWFKNGQLRMMSYDENGEFYRPPTEGPAYQRWAENGELLKKIFIPKTA